MYQVLEIFETKYIGILNTYGYTVLFSNFMVEIIMIIISLGVYVRSQRKKEVFKLSLLVKVYELIKELIRGLVEQQIKSGSSYMFILIMTVFTIILTYNIYGLLPFSYAVTSQLSITVFLSFSLCCGVTIVGFLNMGFEYLYLFITKEGDMPMVIVPFLIMIELLSYVARYFSLGLRLFANMMAGHSLMVILSKFFLGFFDKFVNILDFVLILLLLVMLGIVLLEVGVSFLQAYVFVLLISIYMSEAINYE